MKYKLQKLHLKFLFKLSDIAILHGNLVLKIMELFASKRKKLFEKMYGVDNG